SATQAGAPTASIVIENDGRDARHRAEPADRDFRSMDARELREWIGRGGIVGLGGATFPTLPKLATGAHARAITLLINGAECEPYISCDEMLMRERAQDIVHGARILMHALEAGDCIIAIEDDAPLAEGALREALAKDDAKIRLRIVPSVYPSGGERQLIAAIFGREVPFGGLPPDIGILCHNVGTAAAIARWVRDGEPLVS